MMPACGDPLPQIRENPLARIIFLNTQWWLRPHLRDGASKDHVRETLSTLLCSAGDDQVVIVVGHHPLESHGPHGGNLSLIEYLFPPLPLALWLGISPQDLSNSKNRELVGALETTMGNRPLIYAAGHEHSLQILKSDQGPCYQLVSGAGSKSKLTPVWHDPVTTLFAFEHAGFMEVDVLDDRRVFLSVFIPDHDNNNEPVVVFSTWLEHTKVHRRSRLGHDTHAPRESNLHERANRHDTAKRTFLAARPRRDRVRELRAVGPGDGVETVSDAPSGVVPRRAES